MLRHATMIGSETSARHSVDRGTPAQASHLKPRFSGTGSELVSPEDRMAAGRALREDVRRKGHAEWKSGQDRRDAIETLLAGDTGRLRDLVPIRYGRMLQSPFAFFRGAAAIMAADLANTPATGIKVQLCGDCHLSNFGGFATPERNVIFDINDFDETLPGPWEWDVKRLGASLVLAARSIGLNEVRSRDVARSAVRSYRKTLRKFTKMNTLQVWYSRLGSEDFVKLVPKVHRSRIRSRIGKTLARSGTEADIPKLEHTANGDVSIRDTPTQVLHPEKTHVQKFGTAIDKVFGAYRNSLPDDRKLLLGQYRVADAAMKVSGIASVGRRCWIALLASPTNDALFLQFKEAAASVLEPYAGKSSYAHHGQRIVCGQRLIQPASDLFLGWVTVPSSERRRHFYVRQLRDAKIKPLVETFDADMLSVYGKACGQVLARAHAKTGCQFTISGYLGRSDLFDEAVADFAVAYADQTERDHAALKAAIRSGRIKAHIEQ